MDLRWFVHAAFPNRAGASNSQSVNEPGEVGSYELPFERLGEDLMVGLEGEDPGGELVERDGIGPGEDLASEDAGVDLDLVEPARVDGQVDEAQGGMLALEPLDGGLTTVRGAVVDDPEHAPRRAARLAGHDLVDQPPERHDPGLGFAAPEELGPDHRRSDGHETVPPATAEFGRNFRLLSWDSIVVGVSAASLPFLPVLLARFGATNLEVSLLYAVPAAIGLWVTMPIGRFLARRGETVRWFSRSRLALSAPLFATAGIAVLVPPGIAVPLVLVMWTAASLPSISLGITHTVILEAVGGPSRRYQITSRRWSLVALSYAVAIAVASQVLERLHFPANYAVLFLVFGLAGLLSAIISSRIRLDHGGRATVAASDDREPTATRPGSVMHLKRALLPVWGSDVALVRQHPAYLHFTIASFMYLLGVSLALPLIPLYYVRSISASDAEIGLLTTTYAVSLLLGYAMWRRLFQARGSRVVLLAATLGYALHPGLLAFAPSIVMAIILSGWSGLARAGIDLSLFDALMKVVSTENRTILVSINQTVALLAVVTGSIAAPLIADRFGIGTGLIIAAVVGVVGAALFAKDSRTGLEPRARG